MKKSSDNSLEPRDVSQMTTYHAGILQASTHRSLQKHCDEILAPYGITKMQWLVIGTINDAGTDGIRITELAKALDTTLSYLTNTINLLESKNILERYSHDSDSRSKLIRVSRQFEPDCDTIEKYLRKRLRESIYANVDPNDFRVYMKVLQQLANVD